jgi:2-hydroxychromene-2-carboxylate isomerase
MYNDGIFYANCVLVPSLVLRESVISNKRLLRIKIRWLHSHFRKRLLKFRYFTLAKLFKSSPVTEVYLALNDPHSFMLIQILAQVEKSLNIPLNIYLVWECVPGMTIAPKLQKKWAILDANIIAQHYNLKAVVGSPTPQALTTGQQKWQLMPKTITNALTIFIQTWFDEFDEQFLISTPMINYQLKNQSRLIKRGHYASGSMFFAGEWFVGVDRFTHLVQKLQSWGLLKNTDNWLDKSQPLALIYRQGTSAKKVSDENDKQQLEVFISLRSPYSYLGFVQALRLKNHYNVVLKIKLVFPLMMRGETVPINKQKYIYLDAIREAKKLNIPFTCFADPLGQGILNAYELFLWAERQGKAESYILACFEAIYVNGVDLADENSISNIYHALGLDLAAAKQYASETQWHSDTESHHHELKAMGYWGVPCFQYQQTSCWGQDRLIQIEQAIIKTAINE